MKDTARASAPPTGPTFIRTGQTQQLYMQAPISNTVVFLIGIIYFFILSQIEQRGYVLIWILVLFGGGAFRLALWHLRKKKPESRTPEQWMLLYSIACAIMGLCWSIIYPLIYFLNDPVLTSALLMLGLGVISSSVPILSVRIAAFLAYILPQGVTILIALVLIQDSTYSWVALAFSIYLVMTILFARNSNKTIVETLSLEEKNMALIASLNDEISQREEKIEQRTLQLREKNRSLSNMIDAQLKTTESLKQLNVDLQATLQAIPDLLFELDIYGSVVELWASDSTFLIEQKQFMIGHNVRDVLSGKAAAKVMAAIGKAQQRGQSHGDIILTEFQNQLYWFELSTSRKPQADGPDHFLMLFRDITEKKRMEDEIFNMKKLESVGVLAGGIAHDFNNILTSILGRVELAAKNVRQNDTVTVTLLEEAKEAAHRAAKLTQQLLTFSKGGDPVKETTSLTELVEESSDFVLLGSQVTCTYHFSQDLWMVYADSGQVGQVIQNITINAKEAMEDGGTIEITCENVPEAASRPIPGIKPGNYVRISIKDHGRGISPEIIDLIFDPYYTTKEEGSGLGLAICHTIVKKHQGTIMVYSLPGQETVFTIYLPAIINPQEDVAFEPSEPAGLAAKRILVMDDDQMVRELTEFQLSELGHTVTTVEEGAGAIDAFVASQEKGIPFDLVIMDLTIRGGMGGAEAVQKLLAIDSQAKVIVASGYSTDPVMAQYRKYGFCAALTKPFDLKMLKACINKELLSVKGLNRN